MSIRWQFEDVGDPAAMLGGGELGGRENAPKSLKDLGIIGTEGELYFNPSKRASLDLPSDYLQAIPGSLPIFPHDGIICPGSAEWLTATDMRLRQMFQENKRFGVLHHSPTNQRVALTGTIVKIKERQFSPDGRIFVSVEGLERFYVREFVDENPYLLAHATIFRDFADFRSTIDRLEYKVANRVRINMHMIQWLFPSRSFSMNAKVADNFPPPLDYAHNNTRTFAYIPDETVLQRRSEFVFGVINMLQITPAAKLALMQVSGSLRGSGGLCQSLMLFLCTVRPVGTDIGNPNGPCAPFAEDGFAVSREGTAEEEASHTKANRGHEATDAAGDGRCHSFAVPRRARQWQRCHVEHQARGRIKKSSCFKSRCAITSMGSTRRAHVTANQSCWGTDRSPSRLL